MDVSGRSSIKEVKDFQTNISWIPTTPGKPGVMTLPLTRPKGGENHQAKVDCTELQTNQAALTHAAGATAEVQNAVAYLGSTNLAAAAGTSSDDAIASSSISSQFEPVTPHLIKSKGRASNASSNREGQSDLDLGQSELQENHKLDKEVKQDTKPNRRKKERRKHRPKVVIEGKPRRGPTPRSEKQPGPGETKTEKRKYVLRNEVGRPATSSVEEVNNSTCREDKPPSSEKTPTAKRKYITRYQLSKSTVKPSDERSGGTIGPTKVSRPVKFCKSCKRSLNFEFESPTGNKNPSYRPSTSLDLHANRIRSSTQSTPVVPDMEATRQFSGVSTTYDITCSPNQEMRKNSSQPKMQYPGPPTPQKVSLNHDKVMVGNQSESRRRNLRSSFSDLPQAKWPRILQLTPKSPDSSNCLLHGEGLKRLHSCRTDEAQFYSTNAKGSYFNSMQAYQPAFPANEPGFCSNLGMYHPAIYKKKRTKIGQRSATSYTNRFTSRINQTTSSQCNISGSPGNISVANRADNRMHNFGFIPTLVKAEWSRRRSYGATRVHNLASLHGIDKKLQTSASKEATKCGYGERYKTSTLPKACTEAPVTNTLAEMKTIKRSETSVLVSSTASNMHTQHQFAKNARGPMPAITSRGMSQVDVKHHLDVSRESIQNQGESGLVFGQIDESVDPFDSSFVTKRKPRARVDVDDETDSVWRLLLQDINSEGIDGTDEYKAKWWKEERRVFSSRTDSFIARMHLVQGNRRFSPWKGSLVDSVVGVFLTQNVADHLSSSAFMSLAAQFPLKAKSGTQTHEEKTSIITEEPETCERDPNVTIRWHKDQPNQPNHGEDSSSNTYSKEEKTAGNDTESNENCTQYIKSVGHSAVLQADSSREGLDQDIKYTVNCFRDRREWDDWSSSRNSVVSSQKSAVFQTSERTESINFCGSASFASAQGVKFPFLHKKINVPDQSGSSEDSGHPSLYEEMMTEFYSSCNYYQSELVQDTSVAQGTKLNEHLQDVNFPVFHKEIDVLEQRGSSADLGRPSLYGEMMTEFYSSCNYRRNELVSETVIVGEVNCEQHTQVKGRNYEALTFPTTIVDGTKWASIVVDSGKTEKRAAEYNLKNDTDRADTIVGTGNDKPSKASTGRPGKEKLNFDWDSLRLQAQGNVKKRERTASTMDSVDWEAVRCANVNEIAHTIRERGMNNILAERIKDFLNRLVRDHGSIDLEWLRYVPPDKAKEYLLSFRGLGLKSVECVRLLTLHQLAFPVDTNVGRIAVRLGWVPLRPLPESLQLHLLELYPILESIQKYLWPRLCKLDQRTLYELHYQMITFGKVFCTKRKPNCNACPMRGECRHFASAFASARLALPAPEEKSIVRAIENRAANKNPGENFAHLALSLPPSNQQPAELKILINSTPVIEVPATPEPIVELPATPEQEQIRAPEMDIEDVCFDDPCEFPLIDLNMTESAQNVKKSMENNMGLHQLEMSKALVALTSEAASIPVPKLKNLSRLRTEHHVYELPDSHPLVERLDKREQDDPCPYLLAIWTPGEAENSIQPPGMQYNSQESGKLCDNETCSACNNTRETESLTVRGTILIPCRTAMRGSFPLNGTYFQVNEVFADHDSSLKPINVPRDWLWNLPRRTVYFGTSIPTIFKGLTTECIQQCFLRGFVCVRGFDQKTRAPRPLMARLHFPVSKLTKTRGKTQEAH